MGHSPTDEKKLIETIPISKSFEFRVREVNGQRVLLWAPLHANRNKVNTAFGGSVFSIAVLSCWSLVDNYLQEQGFDSDYVVIQDAKVQYLRPVDEDFTSEAKWVSIEARDKFLHTLTRRGQGRIEVHATVRTGRTDCAKLEARFVAQARSNS